MASTTRSAGAKGRNETGGLTRDPLRGQRQAPGRWESLLGTISESDTGRGELDVPERDVQLQIHHPLLTLLTLPRCQVRHRGCELGAPVMMVGRERERREGHGKNTAFPQRLPHLLPLLERQTLQVLGASDDEERMSCMFYSTQMKESPQ